MGYVWPMMQALFIIGAMAFAMYVAYKKVKKKQFRKSSQHRLMHVVDGMTLGMNQQMYVVKVGEENVLVAFGSQGVEMVKLDQENLEPPETSFEQQYFETEKPSYLLRDTAKKIKGRLMKDEQE